MRPVQKPLRQESLGEILVAGEIAVFRSRDDFDVLVHPTRISTTNKSGHVPNRREVIKSTNNMLNFGVYTELIERRQHKIQDMD